MLIMNKVIYILLELYLKTSEFIRIFYTVTDFIFIRVYNYYSIICDNSSGYICKNVLCIIKILFIRKLHLL